MSDDVSDFSEFVKLCARPIGRLVTLSSRLRPKLSRLVLDFGLSEILVNDPFDPL